MRLSAYVEPDRPDRDAILAAIRSAKRKGIDEFLVTLPSCGRRVRVRCVDFHYVPDKGPVEILNSYEAVRFEVSAISLMGGETDEAP